MKVILLNGSPRKGWNTHKLLIEAECGARETGAETELINIFDLNYTDCKSCFACKLKGNKTGGICNLRDDLRPILEKIHEANAVIIGSPAYYGDLTGETLSLIHRMLFPTMHYENDNTHDELLPIKKKCGLIVTMNATEDIVNKGYDHVFKSTADMIGMIFGSCETLYSCDTYQFDDYGKYYAGMFDEAHKAEHRAKQFPIDLKRAFELGKRVSGEDHA
ncbi:MAG: flavodoxin family protein [Firmicutes bacterium]|nr:flavodoxin family protein [Bacillota bacterium]